MKIILSPQRRDDTVCYRKAGDTLSVDGEVFDFSRVEEGDVLPRDAIRSEWFAGDVTRINGELQLTLILPNPWNYSQAQAFPVPISVTKNGLVELPAPLPVATEGGDI
ncbi:hypothetical protein CJU74_14745 [Pseudomonas fragi]|nr:hypothetical protein CJU74_14745 [Pseudomonas fragi]